MLIHKRDYCKGEKKQMKEITVKELYTLDETIAKNLFEGVTYPWEVLPKISAFILELGKTLPEEEYDKVGEDVWSPNQRMYFHLLMYTDLRSSERTQKSDTVHLFVEMRL